jgi:hypothetical protein
MQATINRSPVNLFKSILILSFVAATSTCQGQNAEQAIQQIRKDFKAIAADTSLKLISLDAEEFLDATPDGGASLTGYYKGDQLVKIEEWIGISYGNSIREFYLKAGQVFFIYDRFDSFIQNGADLDPAKPKTVFEGRYYIVKDKMIAKKTIGKKPLGDKPIIDLKEINSTVQQYKKQLGSKK